MHLNLKNSLLRFMQRKGKIIVLQSLIASCFLFFHTALFAMPPEIRDELTSLSAFIEEKILPVVDASERESCILSLGKLRGDSPHQVKQAAKQLIRLLIKKKKEVVNPAVLAQIGTAEDRLFTVQEQIEKEPFNKLEAQTNRYFRGFFEARFGGIEFHEKTDGVQLGRRVVITLKGVPDPIIYYVKTHRGGLLSPTQTSGSAGPKPVDPRELFVYKVFELAGIGPEVHFFFDDAENFYIATKDAGFDELDRKQKGFLRYGQVLESTVPAISSAIQEIVAVADKCEEAKPGTLAAAEALEASLSPTGLNILRGLTKADIISRIFSLSDFIINTGNIGFIVDGNLSKFRIIDFTTPDRDYEVYGIFRAFLKGNGRFRYVASQNKLTRYALYSRQIDKKVQAAKEAMKDLTAEHAGGAAAAIAEPTRGKLSEKTLEEASIYVKKLMQSCAAVSGSAATGAAAAGVAAADLLKSAGDTGDLDEYVAGIKANLAEFVKGLESYGSKP